MYAVSTSSQAYHHGALKTALLDAADKLLDEGGVEAVSLREAARRAGVSAMAPYRHFADKEALLAALATRGFREFGAALGEAVTSAVDSLAEMGRAYVRFALARPGRFRLMFGSAIGDRTRHPELCAAGERTSRQLLDAVEASGRAEADPRTAAVRAWSIVHGLSHLLLDGMLPGVDPEEIARAVTTPPPPLHLEQTTNVAKAQRKRAAVKRNKRALRAGPR
jgi:AcrR family transcriptional regulator